MALMSLELADLRSQSYLTLYQLSHCASDIPFSSFGIVIDALISSVILSIHMH